MIDGGAASGMKRYPIFAHIRTSNGIFHDANVH